MNTTILDSAFQHPADGWYQIEALGEHPHHAGIVQVIDRAAAEAIAKRFNEDARAGALRHGRELLIDHEHFSEQPDQETRAYGWLQELEHRADGIYGRIRWTKTGKEAVDGGDYRFFSTEYAAEDLQILNHRGTEAQSDKSRRVRPLRLAGLTLTNMNNNRGQRPITNRSGTGVPPVRLKSETPAQDAPGEFQNIQHSTLNIQRPMAGTGVSLDRCNLETHGQDARATTNTFADASASAVFNHNPSRAMPGAPKGTTMKSVCTLLGLSAEADETAVHAAVSRLLNRGDITTDALAALRAEQQSLAEQNQILLSEQAEALLDGCGVKDERLRNRLTDGLKRLKNRQERLGYLADFGYEPGKLSHGQDARATTTRVLNRGANAARELPVGFAAESEQAVAVKIQNRASELQGKGMKYDAAWNQARREILKPSAR